MTPILKEIICELQVQAASYARCSWDFQEEGWKHPWMSKSYQRDSARLYRMVREIMGLENAQ